MLVQQTGEALSLRYRDVKHHLDLAVIEHTDIGRVVRKSHFKVSELTEQKALRAAA